MVALCVADGDAGVVAKFRQDRSGEVTPVVGTLPMVKTWLEGTELALLRLPSPSWKEVWIGAEHAPVLSACTYDARATP